jgi:hypothetical protein
VKETLGSSETSVVTRATWHNIPEDTILHSHHRENLKSYISWLVYNYSQLANGVEENIWTKGDGVTRGWRKLHNEELHNLYSSPSVIRIIKLRRMRWARHVARMGEKRNVYRLFVGKPEGRRPLGRLRRRWIDNIKMDLFRDRSECCGLDWFGSG